MIYYPEDNIQQIGEFISANNDNKLVVCVRIGAIIVMTGKIH